MKAHRLRLLGLVMACAAGTSAQASQATASWTVSPDFKAASDDGAVEYNVSGIACEQSASETRSCMIIDDELTFAERVTLDVKGRRIVPSKSIEIASAAAVFGTEPTITCKEKKKPKDVDGEAVAEASGTFYVIGSHGCGRNSGNFRSSSFLLGRVSPSDDVAVTFRVSEALQACPAISRFYGKRLQTLDSDGAVLGDENGLNIEGLAVAHQRLWVGLRGPVVRDDDAKRQSAFIISMDLAALFTKDQALGTRIHPVVLGEDVGIRDLASLQDGRLLVLAGPRTNAGSEYSIVLVDPADDSASSVLKLPPSEAGAKQEGMLVLQQSGQSVDLLILQDGPKNGEPYQVRAQLPARAADLPENGGAVCAG